MRYILLKNLRLKVLALVFASALWFFVTGQSNTEIGVLVPLGFKSIPRDMAMTSVPPSDVEVRVIGPKLFITDLSPSQIIAELDLSGAKEGVNSYRLLPNDIVTPMGIDVLKIRPASIDIRLERVFDATFEVKPRITGRPAAGFKVAGVSVTPRTVKASVLKKDLPRIEGIYTKPVNISGLRSSTDTTAQLDMPDNIVRSVSAEKVNVRISIEKER